MCVWAILHPLLTWHCVADRINDSSKLMQHFDASDYKNGLQGRKGFSSLFFRDYFRGTTNCAESLTGVFHVSHPLKLRTTCCDSFYLFSLSYIVFSSLVYLILCSLVLRIFTLNICLEYVAMKLFFLCQNSTALFSGDKMYSTSLSHPDIITLSQ